MTHGNSTFLPRGKIGARIERNMRAAMLPRNGRKCPTVFSWHLDIWEWGHTGSCRMHPEEGGLMCGTMSGQEISTEEQIMGELVWE